MGESVINVRDYVGTYIGSYTINKVREEVEREYDKGNRDIKVNIEGLSMNKEYIYDIADMIDLYGCSFIGIGNRKEEVDAMINTGVFIKENLGSEEYVNWFREQVEKADYPLMIRDNRLKNNRDTTMNVIKPIIFDNKYFYFDVIRPTYLEPVYLEDAIEQGENIYMRDSVNLVDISKKDEGFRFASNEEERYTLDIFDSIISKRN